MLNVCQWQYIILQMKHWRLLMKVLENGGLLQNWLQKQLIGKK